MSDKLPKGWTTTAISDLFEFKYGKSLVQEKRHGNGRFNVYGSNGIVGRHDSSVTNGPTIIVGRKGSVGEVHFSPEPCWPIDTTYFVDDFAANIPPKYWSLFLKALGLGQEEKSSAIPGVSRSDIYLLDIPVPPLPEQRRIVAKLEKLLDKVNASQKRLERIPQILKRFRQSVLAAACSGRLTEDWREENKISEEWKTVTLDDVAEMRLGKMLDNAKNIGEPTGYIRNINVRWFTFDLNDVAEMRVTPDERKELNILDGDVFVCEGGEPGRCAVWRQGKTELSFQKAIHRVRPNDSIFPEWLTFSIKNDADSQVLEEYFTGTTIKHLTGRSLRAYSFAAPTLTEQQEIVRRVEALFSLADQIEARYTKAKTHVDKLTQSILAKAFRGELVPQDPNDEPASVLLERIRAERTNGSMDVQAKTRKKKR